MEQFTYDADGNMTSDGRFHYNWNGENRLVCASNAEVVVTYAYDHRGRMVTKTLCTSAPLRLIKTTTYIWDDWNIIREVVREGASVAVTDNIWGLDLDGTLQGAGGVGGLLAVLRSDCTVTNFQLTTYNSQLYYPTYDANGNISEYVSTNGEIVAHYDYSPFGEPLVASGSLASTFTHQFSTKPYCAVTGFSEYQMRKYRPVIGRWLNRDHAGYLGGYNLLSFVRNDPCSQGDLLGLTETNPYETEYYEVVGPYYQLDTQLGADEWGIASAMFSYRFHKGSILKKPKKDCSCSDGYRWTVTFKREVEFYTYQHKIKLPQWKGYENASVDEKKAWDDMIIALTAHEEHHIKINNAFNSLVIFEGTGTDCLHSEALKAAQEKFRQKVDNDYKSRVANIKAQNEKFDEDTDHGVKNGVVLPQI